MQNISVALANRPGALAAFGETLGNAGISLEGGGVFAAGAVGLANFLVHDGSAARDALEQPGIQVASVRDVLVLRLRQGLPGQLGNIARQMDDAGVNIEIQYSGHANRLILIVDDMHAGRAVAKAWMQGVDAP
jgi:hypothetical protein